VVTYPHHPLSTSLHASTSSHINSPTSISSSRMTPLGKTLPVLDDKCTHLPPIPRTTSTHAQLLKPKQPLPFHSFPIPSTHALTLRVSPASLPHKSSVRKSSPSSTQKSQPIVQQKTSVLQHVESKLHRYYGTYPTSAALTLTPFGRPSRNHSFLSEATFDHVLIHLLKSSYLTKWEHQQLLSTHPLYSHLSTSIHRFRNIDFRPLSLINKAYASQTKIPTIRLTQFTAAILHYNFHIASVIRFCGNNYINSHLNPESIKHKLQGVVPADIVDYVYRALSVGAPSRINATSSAKNFWEYLRYGNHKSITSRPDLVQKSLVKEEKYNYVLPFPNWMARFIPNLHVSPEGIIVKEGKKDRIIYDASFHVHPHSFCPNDWTTVHDEPPIYYGSALYRHLSWIWNLRISYPDQIIYLWDDDVSGAFRIVKYNPEVASAFSAMVNGKLWIPVGQVFGGNTSAQNFEGIARARECLSSHFSTPEFIHLIKKHEDLLKKISYYVPSKKLVFTQAHSDSKNSGVFDKNGQRLPTPHNTFVDDNHIADIRSRITLA